MPIKKVLFLVVFASTVAHAGVHIMNGDIVSSMTISRLGTDNLFMTEGGSITNNANISPINLYPGNNNGIMVTGASDSFGRDTVQVTPTFFTVTQPKAGLTSYQFTILGSSINFSAASTLCSDGSSTCILTPMAYGTSTSGNGLIFDRSGKIITGGIKHKTAKLIVGGSALIGTGFSDVGVLPTNGLLVTGDIVGKSAVQLSTRTLSALSTLTPGDTFQMYGCVDCVTDTICVSSGVGTGAWVRASARSTACQ